MFNKEVDRLYKIMAILILVSLVGFVGCAKKVVKPTKTAPEKFVAEPIEELDIARIEKEPIPEKRIDIKEVKKIPELKDVYFEFDKSDLTLKARESINENVKWLKDNPKVKVLVEGHCDERGTIEYNLALGQRRATSVRNYMISLAIKPERINTISYGEEKPIDPRHNEEAWAKNRRAHTVVIVEK